MTINQEWFDDYVDEAEDIAVAEYDITSTPNDFNVSTLFSFVESGAIIIPGFQRHFVWDLKRSSKLIESLILGLPVPQIFLYEQAKNKFLVIDGQQRLMSIYYFLKQRYPRKEKRAELRLIFSQNGNIPDAVLHDDTFFSNFRLSLQGRHPNQDNPYDKCSYSSLGDAKIQLDLRPIRNVIVKQNSPDDDSSIYEIFSRLNSGGVNLKPQEIRLSLYHSDFYEKLETLNTDPRWRRILANQSPDLHLKDVEILLRLFAMLVQSEKYAPSMVNFLNLFSRSCQQMSSEQKQYLTLLFDSFLAAASDLPEHAFINKGGRFSIALIESVFYAATRKAFAERRPVQGKLDQNEIITLADHVDFQAAATKASTQRANVLIRLAIGAEIITAL